MIKPLPSTLSLSQKHNKSKDLFRFFYITICIIFLCLLFYWIGVNGKNETVKNDDVHFIKDFSVGSAKIATPKGTEVKWTYSDIKEYFEKDVLLKYVPDNIKVDNSSADHTVYMDQGTVTFDNVTFIYSEDFNNPYAPKIIYTVSKGKMPIEDVIYSFNNKNISTINGISLNIYCDEDSNVYDGNVYRTTFLYDGIGYSIASYAIPEEEFIRILTSILV